MLLKPYKAKNAEHFIFFLPFYKQLFTAGAFYMLRLLQDLPMSTLRDLADPRILTPEPHLNRYTNADQVSLQYSCRGRKVQSNQANIHMLLYIKVLLKNYVYKRNATSKFELELRLKYFLC
jgi:hypothetical protein